MLDKEVKRTQELAVRGVEYVNKFETVVDSFSIYKSKYDYAKELYGFEIALQESDSGRTIYKVMNTSADSAKILLNTFRDKMVFRDSAWTIQH